MSIDTIQGPTFGSGFDGLPSLIQSNYGIQGNFELVVPVGGQHPQLQHWWRNNDDANMPWILTTPFDPNNP